MGVTAPISFRRKTFRHSFVPDGPCLRAGFPVSAQGHLQVAWSRHTGYRTDGRFCTSQRPVTMYFSKKKNHRIGVFFSAGVSNRKLLHSTCLLAYFLRIVKNNAPLKKCVWSFYFVPELRINTFPFS